MMINGRIDRAAPAAALEFPVLPRTGPRDADLSSTPTGSRPAPAARRSAPRPDARLRFVAAEILATLESRLAGRVHDLKVRVEGDQFIISGVSASYYVKQVAQHVAMHTLDSIMLGRLINEIEVRPPR